MVCTARRLSQIFLGYTETSLMVMNDLFQGRFDLVIVHS